MATRCLHLSCQWGHLMLTFAGVVPVGLCGGGVGLWNFPPYCYTDLLECDRHVVAASRWIRDVAKWCFRHLCRYHFYVVGKWMELGGDYDPPSDAQCSRIGTFVRKCCQNGYYVLTKGTLFVIVLLGGDEMANIKIQITMDEDLARRVSFIYN